MIDEFFQIVVERAGTELVPAFRLACYLLHDSVAVAIFVRQSKQDVESGRGQPGSNPLSSAFMVVLRYIGLRLICQELSESGGGEIFA